MEKIKELLRETSTEIEESIDCAIYSFEANKGFLNDRDIRTYIHIIQDKLERQYRVLNKELESLENTLTGKSERI